MRAAASSAFNMFRITPSSGRAAPVALTLAVLGAMGLAVASAFGGPLTPPAGPVAPSGKTLTEVEPRIAVSQANTPGDAINLFKITQPGSYYLTGNITGVLGKRGIEILASNVTIDLNGFELAGVPGSFEGIAVNAANLRSVEVRGGTVRGWGQAGVDLSLLSCEAAVVRNLRAVSNGGGGIKVGLRSLVVECLAHANTGHGVLASSGSTVTGTVASSNTFNGLLIGAGCTLVNCTATNNSSTGIDTGGNCTITGCTVYQNDLDGINTGSSCVVDRCTAAENAGDGIAVASGSQVTSCVLRNNTLNGIRVSNQCLVLNNNASGNGFGGDGAGILAVGADNRIEGNSCLSADRGIDVDSAGNIIIRNTCSGNTVNWTIVSGNHYGPIIDRTIVAAPAAVSGNSATEALGSTHPNANFTY